MFNQETADKILKGLSQGMSLRAVCREPGMPCPATVLNWCEDSPSFGEQYAKARERAYQMLADEIVEISDERETTVKHPQDEEAEIEVVFDSTAVARNRLRVDTRKWMLSKMLPKIYGDKLTTEVTGSLKHDHIVGLSAETAELLRSLKAGPDHPGNEAPVQD